MSLEKQTITASQQTVKTDHRVKAASPRQIKKTNWPYVFKRSFSEFLSDGCTDLAASLTYFAVLSIFPALLAIVSLLGVFGQGQQTTEAILDFLGQYAPQELLTLVEQPISQLTSSSAAGFALITGVVGALWTASGYIGGFGRALNKIYGVKEGRPIWKLRPMNLLITALVVAIVVIMMLVVLTSEDVLRVLNDLLPVDIMGFAAIWAWLRWPVLFILAVIIVALLYFGTPNIKQPRLRWISPGAVFALIGMGAAGIGFSFYVSNFSKYNATYGLIGGVIVMLLFIWIMNNVLLFGAQINAELERTRELQAGIVAENEIQLQTRDERQIIASEEKQEKLVEEGRQIRLENSGVDFSALAKKTEE